MTIPSGVNVRKVFQELKKGLQEVVAHKEGKIILKSELIEIPKPSKKYGPRKIK